MQERAWATADDGTRIPISVVRRADVAAGRLRAGAAVRLRLVRDLDGPDLRDLAAVAAGPRHRLRHRPRPRRRRTGPALVRGTARPRPRSNTFTDFVACARHLVEAGYTSTDRLAARGGSAGGLLMGAVANLAPEQFRAIHASVPFVDALTTILDPDLPLTVIEWEEWGDPLHDPGGLPLHEELHARTRTCGPTHYPAILATTSLQRHPGVLRRAGEVGGRPAAAWPATARIGRSC